MKKNIYITGAASGIGQMLTKMYVQNGHHVTMFDLQADDALVENYAKSFPCNPDQLAAFSLDVADHRSVENAIEQAAKEHRPHTIINCAGICQAIPFLEHTAEEFERMTAINLNGTRHVVAEGIKYLHKDGHIVLFGSVAAIVACYGYSAYSASKFGVRGFAEILRLELKPKGIDVSLVCPPEVETPMIENERAHRPKETTHMKLLVGRFTCEDACKVIYKGIEKRKFVILLNARSKFLNILLRVTPDRMTHFISDKILAFIQRA